MKLNKKLFPILLAGFLLVGPVIALTVSAGIPTCADECAYIGQRQESGDSYRICGNYDSDCCFEWSQWYTNTPTCSTNCADECSYAGQKKCSDSTYTQTCGNYDSDCCFEWSSPQSCGTGKVCQSGQCMIQYPPTVDIKANNSDGPVTVAYKDRNSLTLSWTSQNADSCTASGDWSGSKSTSGSQSISLSQVKAYTFTLTCKNNTSGNSTSDSVNVTLQAPNAPQVVTKGAVVTY